RPEARGGAGRGRGGGGGRPRWGRQGSGRSPPAERPKKEAAAGRHPHGCGRQRKDRRGGREPIDAPLKWRLRANPPCVFASAPSCSTSSSKWQRPLRKRWSSTS